MQKRRNRTQSIAIPLKSVEARAKESEQASTLKIGEVAKKSGIPVVTLRYYENEGLIKSLDDSQFKRTTHRWFSRNVFLQLEFIKICREAGFSIPQIKSLTKLYRGFKVPSKAKMAALKRSIDLIRDQKVRLSRIEKALLRRLRDPEDDLDDLFEQTREMF